MTKASKALGKVILSIDYELNSEDIDTIKNRLEDAIRYLVAKGSLSGDQPEDAKVGTWLCEVSVAEVS